MGPRREARLPGAGARGGAGGPWARAAGEADRAPATGRMDPEGAEAAGYRRALWTCQRRGRLTQTCSSASSGRSGSTRCDRDCVAEEGGDAASPETPDRARDDKVVPML